jgi:phage major head subunit gpT-like protein
MEINASQLVLFRTKFSAIFNTAYNLAAPQCEKVSFVNKVGRVEQQLYRWLQGIHAPREFIGDRVGTNMTTAGYSVVNKLWETTVEIPKVDLERDQYGVYEPHIAKMGQVVKLHQDNLVFGGLSDLIAHNSGSTSTGIIQNSYDGVPFYGSHTIGTQTFNNSFTGSLNSANLITAITQIRSRKDSTGFPLMSATSRPLLVVPPALEYTARALATLAWFPIAVPGTTLTQPGAAGENILQGQIDVVVSPFLKTSTEWHLTIQGEVYKPILLQIELEPEFLAPPQFFNSQWSDQDIYRIGTRAAYVAAPGLPEFAIGSTGTGN